MHTEVHTPVNTTEKKNCNAKLKKLFWRTTEYLDQYTYPPVIR